MILVNKTSQPVDYWISADGESAPFSITIPKSGKGMTVTMGLFQE